MLRDMPVTTIPGVGQAKQKCLAELGIQSVYDLLHYFPRRFEDRRVRPIEGIAELTQVTVHAVVEGIPAIRWMGRKSVMRVHIRVEDRHTLTAVWFNQHYLRDRLTDGRILLITGRLDPQKRTLVASHTEFRSSPQAGGDIVPVYGTTKGLTAAQLRQMIDKAITQYAHLIPEILPAFLVRKYRLVSRRQALIWMHRGGSDDERRQSHRRLAFEEFFLFQLQLQTFRMNRRNQVMRQKLPIPLSSWDTFAASLPHMPTDAQKRASAEIARDLSDGHPMVRLLQGDVGSGKTWVALYAAYAVTQAGAQTALMAPTEVLAEQLYEEAMRRLSPLGVGVACLTGSTPAKERRNLVLQTKSREVDVLVGTHALITEDVVFQNLALVITDEQHRFGVSQRAELRQKGEGVHVLMMSATPIPRTLALAVYGDLDVSILNERPKGRKPIQTTICRLSEESRVIRKVRQILAAGRQAYVVAPLIEESEDGAPDVLSALTLEKNLTEEFAGFRVGLLHGRMNSREKEQVMREFASGAISVLVSTTVIEVGIDVPNATVMMIYHAERFGLAQLHQLRGRVGRGTHQSVCILFSDATGEMAKRRLQTLVESEDGFYIAEKDLELRGPGEFLGVRQSGLPDFTVGDIAKDLKIMEVARDEAMLLISDPDFWLLPAYSALRETISEERTATAGH